MVITAAATSTYPLLMKLAFDLLSGVGVGDGYPGIMQSIANTIGGSRESFYLLPVAIFAVTIIAGGANYFQTVLANSFSLRTIRDLQDAMFGHLMRADLAVLQKIAPGR